MKQHLLTVSLLVSSVLLQGAQAAWTLQDTYEGSTFFNGFDFFTSADPTHGFVQYVDQATAQSSGLIYNQGSQVIIKADNTSTTPNGRPSVRISSQATYNSGLFIFDLEHMPFGCATWPAIWLVGPNWPNGGEIDIIEGVNLQTTDSMTLHTASGCTMENVARTETGTPTGHQDCDVTNDPSNLGCGVTSTSTTSYGQGFNNENGGVYATRWTASTGIQIWFFDRSSIPSDIQSGSPNPDSWPTPAADFPFTSCNSSLFSNMEIVLDLTFCGDWAGSVYSSSGCPSDCTTYVSNTPSGFDEAYWRINSFKVYQSS